MPAAKPEPTEHACNCCGYLWIEYRPLDHCPMCGSAAARLTLTAGGLAASAA